MSTDSPLEIIRNLSMFSRYLPFLFGDRPANRTSGAQLKQKLLWHRNVGSDTEKWLLTLKPTVKLRRLPWLDYRTPFLVEIWGFAFWISKWNLQFALVADYSKQSVLSQLPLLAHHPILFQYFFSTFWRLFPRSTRLCGEKPLYFLKYRDFPEISGKKSWFFPWITFLAKK